MASVATYLSFVRVSHTVFALPFAFTGAFLAAGQSPPSWRGFAWILACMVAARSAAMGFNRIVDAHFDAKNPRTVSRELPRGAMTSREAWLFVTVAAVAFVAAAFQISALCGWLSPVALVIVGWYSLAKRYTYYTQAFLGLAMAVAPVGGWLAAGGGMAWTPWLLGLAIGLWVAGFDIIYACQDEAFDRAHGLRSIPVKFGIAGALLLSRLLHVATIVVMASLALIVPLGPVYLAGVAAVAVLLAYEQSIVTPDDLSRAAEAFNLNGYVGILYMMTTAAALYVG
ncbi:MAG: putative 4-hydroxybenzoate polyprenyltransferase [Acidobacteria bacterium]|nr:putative 4-hydroxybenzoate polyprenyltransferase [Acidobacteriota bacterium]